MFRISIALPLGIVIAWGAILIGLPSILQWADRTTERLGRWAGLEDDDQAGHEI
jgi:hypothetical protein